MAIKRWNGSGYEDVKLSKYRAPYGSVDLTPKNAYIWDGSSYVKVWPTGPQADAKFWLPFNNPSNFLENVGTAQTTMYPIGDISHAHDHALFGLNGRIRTIPSSDWYNGFTLSMWTRDTPANSGWRTIMHRAIPSGTLTNEAYIVHNTSATTTTTFSGLKFGSTHREFSANYSLPVGVDWFHTVVVWSRTSTTTFTCTFYINGVQRGSFNGTGYPSGSSQFGSEQLWVGGNRTAGEWSGRMDDLIMWDRPLSATEVTDLYNMGRSYLPEITTPAIADLKLDEYYYFTLAANFAATSWTATGLPAGITLSNSGVLSGTPTVESSGTMTITASGGGLSASKNFPWEVSAGVVWVENFLSSMSSGYWDGFGSGSTTGSSQSGGKAGIASHSANINRNIYQAYQKATMSDDQYLKVTLASPISGNLDTGSSGSPMYLRLRGTQVWGADAIELMIRGSGQMIVTTFNGGSGTTRYTGSPGGYGVGDTIRFQVVGNVVSVVNESTGSTLIYISIPSNATPTGPIFRYAGMTQQSNRPIFQVQWNCFAVSRWEFGDA